MIPRLSSMVLILVAFTLRVSATPLFSFDCLKSIYQLTQIKLPDYLGTNVNNDSTWLYKEKQLRVCTNSFGDVSHIGFRLFDIVDREDDGIRQLLFFIERYALERQLHMEYPEKLIDSYQFHIKFEKGDLATLCNMNVNHDLKITTTERRGFMLECKDEGKVVSMVVPADYQLLKGTNAKELEKVIARDI